MLQTEARQQPDRRRRVRRIGGEDDRVALALGDRLHTLDGVLVGRAMTTLLGAAVVAVRAVPADVDQRSRGALVGLQPFDETLGGVAPARRHESGDHEGMTTPCGASSSSFASLSRTTAQGAKPSAGSTSHLGGRRLVASSLGRRGLRARPQSGTRRRRRHRRRPTPLRRSRRTHPRRRRRAVPSAGPSRAPRAPRGARWCRRSQIRTRRPRRAGSSAAGPRFRR